MLRYIVYTGVAALIVWATAYLIYHFHQSLKGKWGRDCGGYPSYPHTRCRHRRTWEPMPTSARIKKALL